MARTRNDVQYAQMRARIIREAARQFRVKGYEVTTLEDLAAGIGVTKAAIYYYFSKKNEILLEMCSVAMNDALAAIDAIDRADPPEIRLRAALSAHVRNLILNLEAWTVFFREIALRKEPKARAIFADQQRFSKVIEGIIEDGIRSGVFREGVNVELTTLGILGMYNWTYRWYRSTQCSLDEIVHEFAEFTERGLLKSV